MIALFKKKSSKTTCSSFDFKVLMGFINYSQWLMEYSPLGESCPADEETVEKCEQVKWWNFYCISKNYWLSTHLLQLYVAKCSQLNIFAACFMQLNIEVRKILPLNNFEKTLFKPLRHI